MDMIDLCERGLLPDALVRFGMRRLIADRLRDEGRDDAALASQRRQVLIDTLRASPIAVETQAANSQHYEVPAAFFHHHLGPRLKYSGACYPTGGETLAEAEEIMLRLYAERAGLADGQRILDLGCGWGSLSLWLAERYPHARIVGLSNSHGQRAFIQARAAERGLDNLTILTGNITDFDFPARDDRGREVAAGFDRIVSVEMLEHMRNYDRLFARLARWLRDDGWMFVHIFAHRHLAYCFEDRGHDDWMSRHFFTGGIMPSETLFANFQDDLRLERQWWVDGGHYARTANHWLEGMDRARADIMPLFRDCYGPEQAAVWFQRWRMFYMACAELFGYDRGREWGVGHYLFSKRVR